MANTRKSQKARIIDLFNRGDTITSYEAFLHYKITRLGAIILKLRQEGWQIESIDEKNPITNTIYSRYKLISHPIGYTVP